jgi:hypothetical protein
LKTRTEHCGRLLNGSASNDRFLVCVGIEVIGPKWLATSLAIAVHLGHQCHDRAGDIPIVLAFGLSHQHKLAKR